MILRPFLPVPSPHRRVLICTYIVTRISRSPSERGSVASHSCVSSSHAHGSHGHAHGTSHNLAHMSAHMPLPMNGLDGRQRNQELMGHSLKPGTLVLYSHLTLLQRLSLPPVAWLFLGAARPGTMALTKLAMVTYPSSAASSDLMKKSVSVLSHLYGEDRACRVQGSEDTSRACKVQGSEDRACKVQGSEDRACRVQGSEDRACKVQGSKDRACIGVMPLRVAVHHMRHHVRHGVIVPLRQ